MKDKKKLLIVFIILLAIGFATVSTTLVITGVIGISTKKSDFNVIFTNAVLDEEERKDFIKGDKKQLLEFETNTITEVGASSILNYEVTNTSRVYDAEVSVTCKIVDNDNNPTTSEYISMDYMPKEKLTIRAGKTESGNITTTLIKSSTTSQSIKVRCELKTTATERESLGEEYKPTHKITFNTDGGEAIETSLTVKEGQVYGELPTPVREKYEFLGWYTSSGVKVDSTSIVNLQGNETLIAKWKELKPFNITSDANNNGVADVGDEIKIGTESFYVISNNGTTINALAKYNLNVGSYLVPNATEGIQNELAKGWVKSGTMYGTVEFSKNKLWEKEGDIDLRIKTNGAVKEALYGANGYENYIKRTISNSSVRLITKSELEALKCSSDKKTCIGALEWLYDTTYWTQTAVSVDTYYVWGVSTDGNFGYSSSRFDAVNSCGVRPVITIPLS